MRAQRARPLTRAARRINHFVRMRAFIFSLRLALVAMLAIATVGASPAMMMMPHDMSGMQDMSCGMEMQGQQSSHSDHKCPATTHGRCCTDCVCACAIGSNVRAPLITLIATYTHIATVIEQPATVVRSSRQPALRLPPPLGPPLSSRS